MSLEEIKSDSVVDVQSKVIELEQNMSVNRDMIKHLTIVAEQIGTNLKQFERKFDNLGGSYCSYADFNRS